MVTNMSGCQNLCWLLRPSNIWDFPSLFQLSGFWGSWRIALQFFIWNSRCDQNWEKTKKRRVSLLRFPIALRVFFGHLMTGIVNQTLEGLTNAPIYQNPQNGYKVWVQCPGDCSCSATPITTSSHPNLFSLMWFLRYEGLPQPLIVRSNHHHHHHHHQHPTFSDTSHHNPS